MLEGFLLLLLNLNAAPTSSPAASPQPPAQAGTPTAAPLDPELAEKFLKVKRVYVESFGDDPVSKQIHAMVINSLALSRRFIITENRERADAILKGAALEKTSQELHVFGEGTAVATAAGAASGSVSGSVVNGTGNVSGSSRGGFVAQALSAEDKSANTETIHDARVALRLVLSDGDLVWATTQESRGAKYKGASADVADKVVKQLLRDLEKLGKPGQ
jgi:curli biogenesis system outer membrane secretion channel CsgG